MSSNSSNNMTCTTSESNFLSSGGARAGLFPDIQILEICLAVIVFMTIRSVRQRKGQGLPVWPLVGMLPSLLAGLQVNLYDWISEVLCAQNGTFTFKGPWFTNLNCVITSDPRNMEHLLKIKFQNFPKGKYFRDTVRDLLGNGIFNADDETWQKQRKTASIEFHSGKFRQLTTESLLELVHARLLPILKEAADQSVAIDLQDVLLRLTFDNVCMIAFGVDPGCLTSTSTSSPTAQLPADDQIPFAKAFEDATQATLMRFITPTLIWKVMRYLDLGFEKKLKTSIKRVDEFANQVIRTRKKELSDLSLQTKSSDLLTVFMGLKDENGQPFSEKFLRDICVNFILAGRDTSSVALSWFFWLLDRNPAVEDRILEEIWRIIGQRPPENETNTTTDTAPNSMIFRPQEVKKMEYLQAALSEALRLYPSVPVDHKEVVEDDVFPDGTVLKKGTKIIYAIYAMGRMESIWGKDCSEYKPERWLRDGRFMSESAYKFTAFNGGPRLCLGKDFAYYQMKFVAASILYHYHVKVVQNHPVLPKLALTMYMKHGLKVRLISRHHDHARYS